MGRGRPLAARQAEAAPPLFDDAYELGDGTDRSFFFGVLFFMTKKTAHLLVHTNKQERTCAVTRWQMSHLVYVYVYIHMYI